MSIPDLPMVAANAPKTANGAKYMTISVNLNITCERLSQKPSMDSLCLPFTNERAMANKILKTTICKT